MVDSLMSSSGSSTYLRRRRDTPDIAAIRWILFCCSSSVALSSGVRAVSAAARWSAISARRRSPAATNPTRCSRSLMRVGSPACSRLISSDRSQLLKRSVTMPAAVAGQSRSSRRSTTGWATRRSARPSLLCRWSMMRSTRLSPVASSATSSPQVSPSSRGSAV